MDEPYSIEVINGITVVRFSKTPTVSETICAMDDVVATGTTLKRLWIFKFGIRLSTDELREIAQYAIQKSQSPPRTAIVVPDDLSFGLARMHDVFREQEGLELKVFRSEEEAIAWLKGE